MSKQHLNVVLIGHHGSGKSTIAGHLLQQLGGIDKRTFDRVERDAAGRPSSRFSWILDNLRVERERLLTVDLKLARFESVKFHYTLIDTPGHPDYLRNTLTGLTQADIIVFVVDCRVSVLETPETAQQIHNLVLLCGYLTPLGRLICAVNQQDHFFEHSTGQERFEAAQATLGKMFKKAKVQIQESRFIPLSGYHGDNLVERSKHLAWFNGPTLIDAIDSLKVDGPSEELRHAPLRMPIMDVFKVGGIGTVPAGKLASGCLEVGMALSIQPAGITGVTAASLESHHNSRTLASVGDSVGVCIKGVPVSALKRGYVVSAAADRPARPAASFEAKVLVVRAPGQRKKAIRVGYCPLVDVHTAHVPCRISRMDKLDRRGEHVVQAGVQALCEGEIAMVELVPCKPLVVEPYREVPALGRFVMRDLQTIIAAGKVEVVKYMETAQPSTRPTAAGQQLEEQPDPAGQEAEGEQEKQPGQSSQQHQEDVAPASRAASLAADADLDAVSPQPEQPANGPQTGVETASS